MLVTFPFKKIGNRQLTAASFLSNNSFQNYEKKTSRLRARYSQALIRNETNATLNHHFQQPGLFIGVCTGKDQPFP